MAKLPIVSLFFWKGAQPTDLPSARKHVDQGSGTYVALMQKVPIAKADALAKGTREDYDLLKPTLLGPEQALPPSGRDAPTEAVRAAAKSKDSDGSDESSDEDARTKRDYPCRFSGRALLRQPTDEKEFPIFPLDNDPKLTAEITWESGRPRWCFHGTPAGGLGMAGFLSQGLVVVALVAGAKHA